MNLQIMNFQNIKIFLLFKPNKNLILDLPGILRLTNACIAIVPNICLVVVGLLGLIGSQPKSIAAAACKWKNKINYYYYYDRSS
jgi:hypothetical protein